MRFFQAFVTFAVSFAAAAAVLFAGLFGQDATGALAAARLVADTFGPDTAALCILSTGAVLAFGIAKFGLLDHQTAAEAPAAA